MQSRPTLYRDSIDTESMNGFHKRFRVRVCNNNNNVLKEERGRKMQEIHSARTSAATTVNMTNVVFVSTACIIQCEIIITAFVQ